MCAGRPALDMRDLARDKLGEALPQTDRRHDQLAVLPSAVNSRSGS
jgi:hypothetical protein